MTNFTDLTGLAGIATACLLPVLFIPLPKQRLAVLLLLVFVLVLIPFGDLSPAAYLRGYVGDLSITTQILLWGAVAKPWGCFSAAASRQRIALLAAISGGALLLYPMALGIGPFDPYRLGYGEPWFIGILLLAALAAWHRQYTAIALCIALATLAWATGWYESANLWDYLLDPLVAIYALSALTRSGLVALGRSRSK